MNHLIRPLAVEADNLPSILKRLRYESKLSLEQLSAQSGMPMTALKRFEDGLDSPSIETLCRLAAGLGTSVTEIISRTTFEGIPGLSVEAQDSLGLAPWTVIGTEAPAMTPKTLGNILRRLL